MTDILVLLFREQSVAPGLHHESHRLFGRSPRHQPFDTITRVTARLEFEIMRFLTEKILSRSRTDNRGFDKKAVACSSACGPRQTIFLRISSG